MHNDADNDSKANDQNGIFEYKNNGKGNTIFGFVNLVIAVLLRIRFYPAFILGSILPMLVFVGVIFAIGDIKKDWKAGKRTSAADDIIGIIFQMSAIMVMYF